MLGHNHAVLASLIGTYTVPLALSCIGVPMTPMQYAISTLVLAGAGVFPDIDHPEASVSKTLGPPSKILSILTRQAAGGHRLGTHSVLGVFVFSGILYGLMWLWKLGYWQPMAFLMWWLVAVSVMLLMRGVYFVGKTTKLSKILPGVGAMYGASDGMGILAGAAAAYSVYSSQILSPEPWLYLSIVIGFALHLLGDFPTPQGIPLAWPYRKRFRTPLTFTTGSRIEAWIGVLLLVGYIARLYSLVINR